ncbi:MAG: ABC transporter permease [Bacteroidota bacterium]|nr:ABC transporter permease [Bacteroidota bacterium]
MKAARTVIEPQNNLSLRLNELWEYRELFYFFTWRDIKVKYKQTYLGIAWAILQPLTLMLLFTFVFSKNLKLYSGANRYEVFVLSGLILWGLFYAGVSHASDSIVQQSNVIKKIYFPRLIIPVSALLVAFFDFIIAFLLFLVFCLIYQQPLLWQAIFLFPTAIFLNLLAAFGVGTLLSALTVKFRDFRYAIPFLLQFLFFATAVIYPLQSIKQTWLQDVLALNPVNGAIEIFRGGMGETINERLLIISVASALFFSVAGFFYFRKTEAFFADLA